MNGKPRVCDRLMAVIRARKATLPADSYTTRLLTGGVETIGAKIIEEAHELIAAAAETGVEGRSHVVHEAADLLFHVLVMLGARDITLAEVEAELARREGVSGLAEKAARHPRRQAE